MFSTANATFPSAIGHEFGILFLPGLVRVSLHERASFGPLKEFDAFFKFHYQNIILCYLISSGRVKGAVWRYRMICFENKSCQSYVSSVDL